MASKKVRPLISIFTLSVLMSALFAFGQTGVKQKVVIIPFRPKLYMGLYDAPIHKFTNWTGPKIKFYFRKQVNALLAEELGLKLNVLDLCLDTSKYKLDLAYLYANSNTELLKVKTIQELPAARQKPNKAIRKGRLVNTSVNLDLYYTHTKPASAEVYKAFEKRFAANYYITINQFDMVPDDMNETIKNEMSASRAIKIHYSIFNQKGEHLFGDYSAILLPKTENNPDLILSKYMKPLIKSISEDIIKVIALKK
jgi:hypothetical protein